MTMFNIDVTQLVRIVDDTVKYILRTYNYT